jgi:tetratricopeptide (TPR) repeat protein
VAASYFLLATVDRDRQRCFSARANFSHAIAIWGTRPNPPRTHLFSAILALVNTDIECDDFMDARKTYRVHSVELQRYSSGPLDDAKLLAIQAALERDSRHYTQADGFLRQALTVYETSQVELPIESADLRSNLAVILSDRGRAVESLAEAERALAIFERSGSRRPERVSALNSAACSLANLGRKEEAGRRYQGALEAAMDLYGEENRLTATIMLNYAQFLRKNKQSRTAAEMQKKGMQAMRSSRTQDNATVDVSDFRR